MNTIIISKLPYNVTILPNVSYEISKHVYLFLWRNLENFNIEDIRSRDLDL